MAVAMVVLKRMLPQSENAVLVVMMVTALLAVAGGDDLIEEIRGLLIEGQISKFVADEQRGLGIDLQLADQRVIDLRGEQMIEHVHGGGEQDALIGLAGAPADDFGQEGLADARIADEDEVGALVRESPDRADAGCGSWSAERLL